MAACSPLRHARNGACLSQPKAVEDFAHDDDGAIIMLIADHHHGVDEAERVGVGFALHARSAALGEFFDTVLQGEDALEAREDFRHRAAALARVLQRAVRVPVGMAEDLAGALVDQELEALFG